MAVDIDTTMPERDVVATLAAALAPVAVHWGYAPFESSTQPPSLPLVAVQRLNYSTAGYEDMCSEAAYFGECVLVIHAWALDYEGARTLTAQVRAAMGAGVDGWRLQNETDLFEPNFRAWRIEGQWLAHIAPD
jgi:hypothetical protein